MAELVFNIPKGLWYANSTETPPNHCLELINMIPKVTGVECRKGNTIKDFSKDYQFIASYSTFNKVILFGSDNTISAYDLETDTLSVIIPTKDINSIPISYIETNGLVMFFHPDSMPYLLAYDPDTDEWTYVVDTLVYKNPETDEEEPLPFDNFDGAVRYRERLYFYKIGYNAIYYSLPLIYGGEIQKYDVSGVFNSKGNLININVMGYSAGAGVESHLIVAYDTGDMLALNGTNPADVTGVNWQAISAIQIHTKLYNQSIVYGTSLFILSSLGIIDVAVALNKNDINEAKYLALPLQDAYIEYSGYNLYKYKNFICLSSSNLLESYYWNTDVGGYCKIKDLNIYLTCYVQDRFFYIDDKGVFYEGFNNVRDEVLSEDNVVTSQSIKYEYVTSFLNGGTSNYKKANLLSIDNYQDGGTLKASGMILEDYVYDINDTHTNFLPSFAFYLPKWQDWKTWNECNDLVWSSIKTQSTIFSIKISTQGIGRTLAVRLYGESNDINILSCGILKLEYEVGNL